jgi:hypothetical protein
MSVVCVDLNDTITAYPEQMKLLMESLQAAGHEVHVLSGWEAEHADETALKEKQAQLEELGCGSCYDKLVVVADPKNHVAEQKCNYMRHVGSEILVDNNRKNGKAARKAGFLALRPQGTKPS